MHHQMWRRIGVRGLAKSLRYSRITGRQIRSAAPGFLCNENGSGKSGGDSPRDDETSKMWQTIRADLEGSVSNEELEVFDKMFADTKEEDREELQRMVGEGLIRAAEGHSKENGGDWIGGLLQKDNNDEEIASEDASKFGKYLLAAISKDPDVILEGTHDESIEEELQKHGVESKRPMTMVQEALRAICEREDVQKHFEDWSEEAETKLKDLGIDENASVREISEALEKAGMMEAVGASPAFPSLKGAGESSFNFLDSLKAYFEEATLKSVARHSTGSNADGDTVDVESQSDEETLKRMMNLLHPILAGGDASELSKGLKRLREHVDKGGDDELAKFNAAAEQKDTDYLKEILGSELRFNAGQGQESRERKRDRGYGADDADDIAEREEMTAEELALEDEAIEKHISEPYPDEGWMMREWIKWNEEKGRATPDPSNRENWLRSVIGTSAQTTGVNSESNPNEMYEHRLPHSKEVEDLTIQVMSRSQLRRVFEIYDEMYERQVEIEKKRPVDDLLALKAQPPEFVGDARLRYSYKDYTFSKSHELEKHPGEDFAQLKVNLQHLPLNDDEKDALKSVVGRRYNAASGDVTITSQKFPSRLHNRIHVRLVLDRAMQAARNIASDEDSAESQG